MSRFTGSTWKKSRRLGISLSGTGKELQRRPYAPGQHGPNSRENLSEYALQLKEKQKLRFLYGLNERQFFNLFQKAGKIRQGEHGTNFMILLEQRLDNLVYRLGFATTRRQARQLVNHGHILVDGKRVDIPSYTVQVGQVIGLREKSKDVAIITESIESLFGRPDYLEFNEDKLEGQMTRLPGREEMPAEINEAYVVEFYNR